jgi:antitoxin CptB
MLNAENLRDAEQRRLAWRCRRGMLELDIVLQRFMAQHFNDLTLDELSAFDVMLELPDNEFWDVLQMKNLHLKSKAQQSIVDKIHGLQAA